MAEPVPTKKRNPAVLQHDEISQENLPDDENIKLNVSTAKRKSQAEQKPQPIGAKFGKLHVMYSTFR